MFPWKQNPAFSRSFAGRVKAIAMRGRPRGCAKSPPPTAAKDHRRAAPRDPARFAKNRNQPKQFVKLSSILAGFLEPIFEKITKRTHRDPAAHAAHRRICVLFPCRPPIARGTARALQTP
jgi:hypothetical protein